MAPHEDSPTEEPASLEPAPPASGWQQFHEQPVHLQLRSVWILVDGKYEPVPTEDKKGLRGTNMFRGMLQVFPDLLVLRAPTPDRSCVYVIAIHPEDVEFCTHLVPVEQPRIVPP